jgi:hypothetical protein
MAVMEQLLTANVGSSTALFNKSAGVAVVLTFTAPVAADPNGVILLWTTHRANVTVLTVTDHIAAGGGGNHNANALAPAIQIGNATSGHRAACFVIPLTFGYAIGDTITWTPNATATTKAMIAEVWTGVTQTVDSTASGTAAASVLIPQTNANCLVVGRISFANDTTAPWGQDNQALTMYGTTGGSDVMSIGGYAFSYGQPGTSLTIGPNTFPALTNPASIGLSLKITPDPTETKDFISKIKDAANWGSAGGFQPGAAAPVGLWLLNEDNKSPGAVAFDTSGNGRNGTYVNGATMTGSALPDSTASKFSQALQQYVEIPNPVGNNFSINPAGGVGPGLTMIELVRIDLLDFTSDRNPNLIGTITGTNSGLGTAVTQATTTITYTGASALRPEGVGGISYVSTIDSTGNLITISYTAAAANIITVSAFHGQNAASFSVPSGTNFGQDDAYVHYAGKGSSVGNQQEYAKRVYMAGGVVNPPDANDQTSHVANGYQNQRGWVPKTLTPQPITWGPRMSQYVFSPTGGEGAGSYVQQQMNASSTPGVTWRLMVGASDGGNLTTNGPGGIPDKGVRLWINGQTKLEPNDSSCLYADVTTNGFAINSYDITPTAGTAPLRYGAQEISATKHTAPVSLGPVAILPFVISYQQAYRLFLSITNSPAEFLELERMTMGMGR